MSAADRALEACLDDIAELLEHWTTAAEEMTRRVIEIGDGNRPENLALFTEVSGLVGGISAVNMCATTLLGVVAAHAVFLEASDF